METLKAKIMVHDFIQKNKVENEETSLVAMFKSIWIILSLIETLDQDLKNRH